MSNSAVLHVPSLPEKGSILDLGDHLVVHSGDYVSPSTHNALSIANIELSIKADALNSECDILAEDVESLTKELGEAFDSANEIKAKAIKDIQLYKDKANDNIFNYRSVETRAIKAEKQLNEALNINKRRSERITEQKKSISTLEGVVKTAKKQLEDAKKSYSRKFLEPTNPTMRIEYKDKVKGKEVNRLVIIQYADHQIHVHDPSSSYLISSQPLFSEDDYVPRFIGYPYPAMLDQHHLAKARIEVAINSLAYEYRRSKGKVLTADICGGVSVGTRKKLWAAGIMFASELDNPETLEKVKALPGIGKKTLETLLIAAKEACKK